MKPSHLNSLRAACLVAGLAVTAIAASAQEIPPPEPSAAPREPSRFALVIEGGTTGVGPALIYTVNPKFTVTVGYTWLDTSYDTESRDADYGGDLNLSNIKAVANWHPWGGTFHFSAGVYATDNEVELTAKPEPGETYEINGRIYTSAQITSITGAATFEDDIAPYIGVGWAKNPARGGWGFYANLGLFFAGDASARLSATGPEANNPQFQNDLRAEEADINDDLEDLGIYPVAQIGVIYRF
jgi:hypothetical protein